MTAPKQKVLELFAGIGGFSLGLEKTGGFETIQFVEIDPYCRAVLKKHWPEVPQHDDVATFEPSGPVDLVTAGFPCQDISYAGKGAGLSGQRSGLFWHIIRTAGMVGFPRLLLENVAALLNRGLGSVLGAMASVGYDAEWHCIRASRFGLPHDRDRLWIVADRHEIGRDRPGLYPQLRNEIRPSAQWEGSPRGQVGDLVDWLKSDDQAHLWEISSAPPGWLDDGVSRGLDSRDIGQYGNAVVPAIPETIGRAILARENAIINSQSGKS